MYNLTIDEFKKAKDGSLFIKKNDGTPMSAARPKQISCLLVRLRNTFVLTRVRSRGTGIYDAMCLPPLMGAHN